MTRALVWLWAITSVACTSATGATPRHAGDVGPADRADAASSPIDDVPAASQQPGPQHTPSVQWRVSTHGPITATAIELRDGSIVFGSHDGVLRRVTHDGEAIYALATDAAIVGRALSVDDDQVIVANEAGAVLRVDASGTIIWRLQVTAPVSVDLVRGDDGVIYVASDGIYAIDARGLVRWHHVEATTIYSTPLITGADLIVYGTIDGRAVAIDGHGALQWTTRVNAAVTSAIERLPDGSLEIHAGGQALAIDNAGALLASNPAGTGARHGAIDRLGTRYFVVDQQLNATRDDGTLLWSYNLGARVTARVTLTSSGLLVVGAEDGTLYALR